MAGKQVFIIGPGFIGWNVLELLVGEGYNVSALVRRKEHGEGIARSGALPIQGDLDNHDLIVKHVVENDVSYIVAPHRHLAK
jgi:nucleoside-diphosphate-sugar epimerase